MAGGNNNITRMSPRQRMINLMYIVLTAMLALNVSSDVLNGFRLVHEGLQRTNMNVSRKAELQYRYLEELFAQNPRKAGPWHEKGTRIHTAADALYKEIEQYKWMIVNEADGSDHDPLELKNEDDLNAAGQVMLNPLSHRGASLREKVHAFRDLVVPLVGDTARQQSVRELLTLDAQPAKGDIGLVTWETKSFDNMPAVAAVTMLTKLQNDIRTAESDAYNYLISNVDITNDLRVNELKAYVIPKSNMIIRGGKYSAQIVLAAVDTAQRPVVYIGGSRLNNNTGLYEFVPGALGTHSFSGYIEVMGADGTPFKREFTSEYTVIEPMATISPTMMNVLYAGIDNPISISVPGVPMEQITATISNGTLTRNGNLWVARVSKVGGEADISVSAQVEGRTMAVGAMKFRIRKLPDPTAYLAIGDSQYKGTPKRISKGALLGCRGVSAALDDGILQIQYSVVSFSTVFFDQMGNGIPEVSAGNSFSARQVEQFKRLKPGKSFFITNIKAKGPDGIVRDISPMEVGLN